MIKNEENEKIIYNQREEIMNFKKIQNEQGKALKFMVEQNDYPSKIRNLMDEIRFKKEKIMALEGQLKQQEKVTMQLTN